MATFQQPDAFKPTRDPAEAWERWMKKFSIYYGAAELNEKSEEVQKNTLLHIMGDYGQELVENLNIDLPDKGMVSAILTAITRHYQPYKNVVFKRHEFSLLKQGVNETIDQYLSQLTLKVRDCDYGDLTESIVRDRLICGVTDRNLKERLLRQGDITLARAIEICRSDEITKLQWNMNQPTQEMHAIHKRDDAKYPARVNKPFSEQKHGIIKKCQWCGRQHKPRQCPAYGKHCQKCNKLNHFAAVCKQKTKDAKHQKQVGTIESYVNDMNSLVIDELIINKKDNDWLAEIKVDTDTCVFKLDTGSDVNILPVRMFNRLKNKPKVAKVELGIKSYSNHMLTVIGTCQLICFSKTNQSENLDFVVMETDNRGILGRDACEKLGLIKRVQAIQTDEAFNLINKYADVFKGLGELPGEHHITINPNVEPHVSPARRIPYSLQDKVKIELNNLEQKNIIEKVERPTEWVHPMLIKTKKGGGLRICLDPRLMNVAIQRQHVQIPTRDELLSRIKGAKIFSVLDAASAFHQIKLDNASADLCTFATPQGRYRFLRLPFGLRSAPEVFQNIMNKAFKGLEGIVCYFDDVLVYGKNEHEHNERLEQILKRAREIKLKFDKNKMQLAQATVKYLGHNLEAYGSQITNERTKAIMELHSPTDKSGLQRFLGMVGYLTRFIPGLSSKTAYLRQLTKQGTAWLWDEQAERDFKMIKNLVMQAPKLVHFDQKQPMTLTADASRDGMGAALLQEKGPIAYASATFTATQRNYSQIEKELLAIIFGCEKFHYYIYGLQVKVETDHKPLVNLVHKPLEKLSPRLQRMIVRLQRYNTIITYVPGKMQYVSDTLSRDSLQETHETQYLEESASVHLLITVSEARLQGFRTATTQDPVMKKLAQYCCEGWPKYIGSVDSRLKKYWVFRDEIHVSEGLVFRGDRLIIPENERLDILNKLHQTHEGIVACKSRARQGIYWPGMNNDIEKFVNNCKICLSRASVGRKEPMMPHQIQDLPWHKIGIDFLELNQKDYITAIDYYSKFIHIQEVNNKTADQVISFIKSISAIHGIPKLIMSDNGPPFDSIAYLQFLKQWDIERLTSSPHFAQSNGMVERAVQTAKNRLRKTLMEEKDYHLVQLNYNSTPHNGMESPAELMMGRRIRTTLPITDQALKPKYDTSEVQDQLKINQELMKSGTENNRVLPNLTSGEQIYYRHTSKDWRPAVVVTVEDSPRSYKVQGENGGVYRRNRRHIKQKGSQHEMEKEKLVEQIDKAAGESILKAVEPKLEPDIIQKQNNIANPTTRSGREVKMPEHYKDYQM